MASDHLEGWPSKTPDGRIRAISVQPRRYRSLWKRPWHSKARTTAWSKPHDSGGHTGSERKISRKSLTGGMKFGKFLGESDHLHVIFEPKHKPVASSAGLSVVCRAKLRCRAHLARCEGNGGGETFHGGTAEQVVHPWELVAFELPQAKVTGLRVQKSMDGTAIHDQPDPYARAHGDVGARGLRVRSITALAPLVEKEKSGRSSGRRERGQSPGSSDDMFAPRNPRGSRGVYFQTSTRKSALQEYPTVDTRPPISASFCSELLNLARGSKDRGTSVQRFSHDE